MSSAGFEPSITLITRPQYLHFRSRDLWDRPLLVSHGHYYV